MKISEMCNKYGIAILRAGDSSCPVELEVGQYWFSLNTERTEAIAIFDTIGNGWSFGRWDKDDDCTTFGSASEFDIWCELMGYIAHISGFPRDETEAPCVTCGVYEGTHYSIKHKGRDPFTGFINEHVCLNCWADERGFPRDPKAKLIPVLCKFCSKPVDSKSDTCRACFNEGRARSQAWLSKYGPK